MEFFAKIKKQLWVFVSGLGAILGFIDFYKTWIEKDYDILGFISKYKAMILLLLSLTSLIIWAIDHYVSKLRKEFENNKVDTNSLIENYQIATKLQFEKNQITLNLLSEINNFRFAEKTQNVSLNDLKQYYTGEMEKMKSTLIAKFPNKPSGEITLIVENYYKKNYSEILNSEYSIC